MKSNMIIIPNECLDALRKMPSDSIDSLVTDPPAGISFMGKDWDHHKGGSKQWIAWLSSVMLECMRVLKPGAHALVWAIPRTSHWTATALEDAGFEIRDVVTHLFGSGFPKSLDISKAIDKAAGAEREKLGLSPAARKHAKEHDVHSRGEFSGEAYVTKPATAEASLWQGFGTALKPASEHWVLCRKPLSEKTVAANVLKWGCGGLNIDASRIAGAPRTTHKDGNKITNSQGMFTMGEAGFVPSRPTGRFPSNLLLSHNEDCVEVGVKKIKPHNGGGYRPDPSKVKPGMFGVSGGDTNHISEDGTETVSAFECTPNCAVAMLDDQSGVSKSTGGKPKNAHNWMSDKSVRETANIGGLGDSGGASRFFYCAKSSKSERNLGCEGLEEKQIDIGDERPSGTSWERRGREPSPPRANHHPTVKPTKFMSYLIRMITPPGGTVLDPFMGSGSTGVAALRNEFAFIGIEMDGSYFKIALARLRHIYFGDDKCKSK